MNYQLLVAKRGKSTTNRTKRRGFTLLEIIVIIVIVVLLAAILYPVFRRVRDPNRKSSCQSNLKQMGLGFDQYSQDYDAYPLVASESANFTAKNSEDVFGWADALQPYLKSTHIYLCPTRRTSLPDQDQQVPQSAGYTDYYFNSRLSGIKVANLRKPASIILSGDGNDDSDLTDASYSFSSLPGAWVRSEGSPAYKHLDGANYAFADGHVKWVAPAKVTVEKPDGKNYTFLIK